MPTHRQPGSYSWQSREQPQPRLPRSPLLTAGVIANGLCKSSVFSRSWRNLPVPGDPIIVARERKKGRGVRNGLLLPTDRVRSRPVVFRPCLQPTYMCTAVTPASIRLQGFPAFATICYHYHHHGARSLVARAHAPCVMSSRTSLHGASHFIVDSPPHRLTVFCCPGTGGPGRQAPFFQTRSAELLLPTCFV